MHRKSLAICVLLLLAVITTPAQQLLKPQNIRFDGTGEYTPAELLAFVAVKKGSVYTTQYLSQTAQNLMGLGVFDKVAFKFDGVDLVYQLHDNPDLYAVTNGNLPIASGLNLEAKLKERVPLFHGKVPSEGVMLDNVRAALQAMVAESGLQANVVSVPAGDSPYKKASAIKFRIETPPIRLGEVHVTGASESMQPAIQKATKPGDSDYDAANSSEFLAARIRSVYVQYGYPAAKVILHAEKPVLADGIVRVPFMADVSEGRAYKLGSIQLAAGLPVAPAAFDKLLQARDKFTPEGALVQASIFAVEQALKGKGFLDCSVQATPAMDDAAGVVNYTIGATTGAQYHLALLKFANVSDQLRGMLMRNWQLMPGDAFDENYVSNFLGMAQKSDPVLQRTLIGVKTLYDVKADPNTHDVNVVIRLER